MTKYPRQGGHPIPVFISNQSLSNSDEIFTTVTEREDDVWSHYFNTFTETTYVILISKDNAAFPHKLQGQTGGRIDITNIHFVMDLTVNSRAIVRVGIITRIDGTDADIKNFYEIPFLSGSARGVVADTLRGSPSQFKTDIVDGVLQHGISNRGETNVAAVNTGSTLDSPAGQVVPALGDIIMKYEHNAGSTDVTAQLFYHNTD